MIMDRLMAWDEEVGAASRVVRAIGTESWAISGVGVDRSTIGGSEVGIESVAPTKLVEEGSRLVLAIGMDASAKVWPAVVEELSVSSAARTAVTAASVSFRSAMSSGSKVVL